MFLEVRRRKLSPGFLGVVPRGWPCGPQTRNLTDKWTAESLSCLMATCNRQLCGFKVTIGTRTVQRGFSASGFKGNQYFKKHTVILHFKTLKIQELSRGAAFRVAQGSSFLVPNPSSLSVLF